MGPKAFRGHPGGRPRRRLRAAPPSAHIGGHDGPCAVGHPIGCARKGADMTMDMGICKIT